MKPGGGSLTCWKNKISAQKEKDDRKNWTIRLGFESQHWSKADPYMICVYTLIDRGCYDVLGESFHSSP